MFSQELLTSGELNHFSLKERMVEIGKRWHKLSPSHKDKYKRQVEEQQADYKLQLENWVKVRWGGGGGGCGVTQCCLTALTIFTLLCSSLCHLRIEPSTKSFPPR